MTTATVKPAAARGSIGAHIQPQASPREAFAAIKSFLKQSDPKEAREIVYEKLRSLVFHLIAGRISGPIVNQWAETLVRVRALVGLEDNLFAERFVSLAELLEQAHHFNDIHAVDEVWKKKHVASLLKAAGANLQGVNRKELLANFGLGDANLSRILTNLETSGLITREQEGRDVRVKLTDYGRRIYHEQVMRDEGPEAAASPLAHRGSLEQLRANWPSQHVGIAVCNSDFVVSYDTGFGQLLGQNGDALHGMDISTLRQRLADMTASVDEVTPDEVTLADGRTFSVKEHRAAEGHSIWVSVDVTDYVKRVELHKKREILLSRELASHRAATRHIYSPIPESSAGAEALQVVTALKHDILTPLTLISHSTHYLMSKLAARDLQQDEWDALNGITNETERVKRLARAIVRIGEVPNPDMVVQEEFAPFQTMKEIVDTLSYTARHTDITLNTSKLAKNIIAGDRIAFEAVMYSFLGCIIDLAKMGSAVDIGLKKSGSLMKVRFAARSVGLWSDANDKLLSLQTCIPHRLGWDYRVSHDHDVVSAEFAMPTTKRAVHVAR
ncbi:hypothetical protein [Rhizobiales bacterium]|uniref:hypothetical protein n=1 Tax=Agrobacterium radiobacter TaxID=362 RepID=UPI000DD0CDF9